MSRCAGNWSSSRPSTGSVESGAVACPREPARPDIARKMEQRKLQKVRVFVGRKRLPRCSRGAFRRARSYTVLPTLVPHAPAR